MSTLSYLITYRDDGTPERRANLVAVLRWVRSLPEVEVVVIEQDAAPSLPLAELADLTGVRWLFCYNPGPFNKGWGFNVGAGITQSALLAFGDADVICNPPWLETVQLAREQMAIVKPYRQMLDLSADESTRVRHGDWNWQPQRPPQTPKNREGQGEYVVFAGGLFLLRREVFRRIGGFDERFRGWGGEDDAMTLRLTASAATMGGLDLVPALHLWHPRSAASTSGQPHYAANLALLNDYRHYTAAQMERLWEVQRQVMGDADKYRPESER